MTNILRDVGEDASLGRVYLPREDLERHGLTVEAVRHGQPGPGFRALMAFEAKRARSYFAGARGALAPADRRALAPAEAMRAIYENILSRMEKDGFQVFTRRYRLPLWQKIWLLVRPGR